MGVRIYDTYEKNDANRLSLEVNIHISQQITTNKVLGPEFVCGDDSVIFQMMVEHIPSSYELELSIKLKKKDPLDKSVYIMDYYQRYGKNKVNRILTTEDIPWRVIDQRIKIEPVHNNMANGNYFNPNTAIINISLRVNRTVVKAPKSNCVEPKTISHLASLHEDTELTDFELRAEDGSVHLHKAIAAAVSPVLRRMFSGAWRETSKGVIEVPGTTKATLQKLKDYIYLDTIPEEGVQQLLLLASFYMMPDLEQRCVNKLKDSVTAETASDLIFLAANNRSHHLLFAILDRVQKGALNVEEIRSHYKTS